MNDLVRPVSTPTPARRGVAVVFAGQGAQMVGMGADLMDTPEGRSLFDAAERVLGWPLKQICRNGPVDVLTETRHCQPALFVHGLLCWRLFQERTQATPALAAGLSLGEFTAHAAAGTFGFEEGLSLVAARGRAMQEACELAPGGMVSLIGATTAQAEEIAAAADVDVANFNCPGQIVLSGPVDRIAQVPELAKARQIKRAVPLNVAGAYHSRLMQPAQAALEATLRDTVMQRPAFPVVANVTAAPMDEPDAIRDALLSQVTGSVRWEQSVLRMKAEGVQVIIECGPGEVLAGLIRRIDRAIQVLSVSDVASLNRAVEQWHSATLSEAVS